MQYWNVDMMSIWRQIKTSFVGHENTLLWRQKCNVVKRQLVEIQMTSTTDLFRRLNSVVGMVSIRRQIKTSFIGYENTLLWRRKCNVEKRQIVDIQKTSTTDLFRRLNSVVGIQASKTAYSIININRVIGGPAAKQRGSSYISLVSKNLCRVPSRALRGAQRAVLRAIISSHDKLRNYGDLN
jgi:hypothetical protein